MSPRGVTATKEAWHALQRRVHQASALETALRWGAPGGNPNPLRGFSPDLFNLRGPPQNPPLAGFEGDRSN
jgi:hypothetical protein